jgi:hypothetical protein
LSFVASWLGGRLRRLDIALNSYLAIDAERKTKDRERYRRAGARGPIRKSITSSARASSIGGTAASAPAQ